MKIGLIATQFPGLTLGGGIAPPTERLALALVERFGSATVLLSRMNESASEALVRQYRSQGIDLLNIRDGKVATHPWWLSTQWAIRETVESLALDKVVVQDWQGLGALLTAGPPVADGVISWLHGGVMYDQFGSGNYFTEFAQYIDSELERIQLQSSSAVVSPSSFLIDWYRQQGWKIEPDREWRIPYLVENPPDDEICRPNESAPLAVAFVGRLSKRKGLDRLLELLEQQPEASSYLRVRIFGRPLEYSAREVRSRLKSLGFDVEVETRLDTAQVWRSLANYRTLVLCPSRLDNSPNVVSEAAVRGHHSFIWPDNGALELDSVFPGLVHNWSSLDEALQTVAESPASRCDSMALNNEVMRKWTQVLMTSESGSSDRDRRVRVRGNGVETQPNAKPDLSVVIASRNRLEHLKVALQSLMSQDIVQPFEIVVVDDHSDVPYQISDSMKVNPQIMFHLIRNSKQIGPAASRNIGAQIAKGLLLVFADDDNYLRPNHLSSLLQERERSGVDVVVASHSNHRADGILSADLVSDKSFISPFSGDHLIPLAFLVNSIGDTNLLVSREKFEAVGGWDKSCAAVEDWQLLTRFVAAGIRVGSTMNPTVGYRINNDGVNSTRMNGSLYRSLDIAATTGRPDIDFHTLAIARAAYATNNISNPTTLRLISRVLLKRFKVSPVHTLMTVTALVWRRLKQSLLRAARHCSWGARWLGWQIRQAIVKAASSILGKTPLTRRFWAGLKAWRHSRKTIRIR